MVRSFGNMRVANNIWSENNIRAENLLITETEVRADTYCDRQGNNCFSPSDVGAPGDDDGDMLVNGFHTEQQCETLGGEVVTEDGATFCRFDNGSCPSGWNVYDNWRTTTSNTCSAGFCSCSTGGESWSSHSVPSCYYDPAGAADTSCAPWGSSNCFATVEQVGCF